MPNCAQIIGDVNDGHLKTSYDGITSADNFYPCGGHCSDLTEKGISYLEYGIQFRDAPQYKDRQPMLTAVLGQCGYLISNAVIVDAAKNAPLLDGLDIKIWENYITALQNLPREKLKDTESWIKPLLERCIKDNNQILLPKCQDLQKQYQDDTSSTDYKIVVHYYENRLNAKSTATDPNDAGYLYLSLLVNGHTTLDEKGKEMFYGKRARLPLGFGGISVIDPNVDRARHLQASSNPALSKYMSVSATVTSRSAFQTEARRLNTLVHIGYDSVSYNLFTANSVHFVIASVNATQGNLKMLQPIVDVAKQHGKSPIALAVVSSVSIT